MLKDILRKTVGGLDTAYYFRHFFFGLLLSAMLLYPMFTGENATINVGFLTMVLISLFFYPYSRFVYESIVGFIFGENAFLVDGILFLFVKLITMAICFVLAPYIAIIGFIYLYYYHTKHKTFEE